MLARKQHHLDKAKQLGVALSAAHQAIIEQKIDAHKNMQDFLKLYNDEQIYQAIRTLPIELQRRLLLAVSGRNDNPDDIDVMQHFAVRDYGFFSVNYKIKASLRFQKLEKMQTCIPADMSSDDYRRRGEHYLRIKKYAKAISNFKRAIEKNNTDYIARELLIYTLNCADVRSAITSFEVEAAKLKLETFELLDKQIKSPETELKELIRCLRARIALNQYFKDHSSVISDSFKLLPLVATNSERGRVFATIGKAHANSNNPSHALLYNVKAYREDASYNIQFPMYASSNQVLGWIKSLSHQEQLFLFEECLDQTSKLGIELRKLCLDEAVLEHDLNALIAYLKSLPARAPLSIDDFIEINAEDHSNQEDGVEMRSPTTLRKF